MNRLLIILVVLACLAGCRPKTPEEYIQPQQMEDILVDFHLAKAMAQEEGKSYDDQAYKKLLYWEAVLQKHGVTQADFDSSLVYYYTYSERFEDVYKRVLSRLQDQALSLGATEGEIGRYADLSENGDTANIWKGAATCVMLPKPPYHRYEFSVQGDSLYREGDEFLVQFVSDFFYQSGTKDGLFYAAVDYPDTVITRQTRFSYSGLNQLRIASKEKQAPLRVHGFFYLGGANDATTTMRMLFIKDIQLIRFHKKKEDEKSQPVKTDSVTSAPVTRGTVVKTSSSGNTTGTRTKILSADKGTSPNRMVERIDSLKTRR